MNSDARPEPGLRALRSPKEEFVEASKRPTCSKGSCPEPAAEDSVRCVKHRDEQRRNNQAYAKKQGLKVGSRRGRRPKAEHDLGGGKALPALMQPKAITGARQVSLHGNVLTVLDAAIVATHADLEALERARLILTRTNT